MAKEFYDRGEAAAYLTERGLKTSKGYLQKLAHTGGGPSYQMYGSRVRYTPQILDAWADTRLSAPRRSSSDPIVSEATSRAARSGIKVIGSAPEFLQLNIPNSETNREGDPR